MMRNRSWLAGLASKIFPRRFAAARRAARRQQASSSRRTLSTSLASETLEPRHLLTVSVGDLGFDEPIEPVAAQTDTSGMWQSVFDPALVSGRGSSDSVSYLSLSDYASFTLDQSVLDLRIDAAPSEAARGAGAVITLPTPEGGFQQFAFWDSPIMAPELAAQFPEIQTFVAQGIDDPAATARLDWTPQGFHAQVLSPDGAYYVDPFYHLEPDGPYVSYFLTDYLPNDEHAFVCYTEDVEASSDLLTASQEAGHHTLDADHDALDSDCHDCQITTHETEEATSSGDSLTSLSGDVSTAYQYGNQLRTYDIAVATTGEYTAFQGGTVSLGLAAVATTINRLNLVYETDVSVRLNLIAENDLLIFTDGSIDPYTNNDLSAQLSENQLLLDDAVTNGFISEYDIGHVFSTASGGLARLASVGVPGDKAQGASGVHPANQGMNPTFIALAGHEIGHQFGAHHTFNAPSDNRTYYTAVEPGSGSTLMSYAGALGSEDLQSSMDSYYHAISILEIVDTITTGYGNAAATITNTGNNLPTVSAGPDYSIPAATPFFLTASGSDADAGDTLTYSWEQYQLGDAQSVHSGDNGSSPLFRSWSPTPDATRFFPRAEDVIDGSTVVGETLPTTTRYMNFVVTARDNRIGGGGTATDYMTVTVYDTGSPFAVTSPNSAVSWPANSTQTVSWNVAGTSSGSINVATVDILVSTDGGTTYSAVATGVANDGSHNITVPNTPTSAARLKVQAVGNIFYDISDTNFSILPEGVYIVDNADVGFSRADPSNWYLSSQVGYGVNNSYFAATASNIIYAPLSRWSQDLPNGQYRVAASWMGAAANATDAYYDFYDGGDPTNAVNYGTYLGWSSADHSQDPAEDFIESAVPFQSLEEGLLVESGTLRTELSAWDPYFPGWTYVIADAIRYEKINDGYLEIALASSTISEAAGATTATITRRGNLEGDLAVSLVNYDPSEVSLQTTVTILDGQSLVTVPINAVDDDEEDGTQSVTIRATATDYSTGETTLLVTDEGDSNQSPAVTSPGNQSDAEGDSVSLQLSASDPDGDSLTWNASGLPSGLSIDSDTGLITGTLGYDASGSHAATVTVSDGSLSASTSFTWTITDTNRAPVVSSPGNQSDAEGEAISLQMTGSDPDGQSLTWNASGLPSGLSIDSDTGLITGTLGYDASGSHAATVTVSDGSLSASTSFTWAVTNTNRSPAITNPGNQSDAEGEAVSLQMTGSDPDGQTLTWNASGLPSGLSIDSDTGLITGALAYDESGSYSVSVSATDGELSDSQSFTWTVANTNRAPVIVAQSDQSDAEGDAVSLQLSASDPDGDALTWNASGLPSGLSINTTTGLISGTLGYDASGSHGATVTVSDGSLSADTSFAWTVSDTNLSEIPVITLLGDSPYVLEASSSGSYSDPGATAWDAEDGNISGAVEVSGQVVDLSVPGTYVLDYNVQDSDGNQATTVSRTVIVQDSTAPQITLAGSAEMFIEAGFPYTDAGATVSDSLDGDISGSLVVSGDVVDVGTTGSYTVLYNAQDTAGNAADQVTRTVTVQDTLRPIIAMSYGGEVLQVSDQTDTGLGGQVNAPSGVPSETGLGAVGDAGRLSTPIIRSTDFTQPDGSPVESRQEWSGIAPAGAVSEIPVAAVWDHVDTLTPTTSFVLIDQDGTSQETTVEAIDWDTRSTYLFQYDAVDNSGNYAEQVVFALILDDQAAPVINVAGGASETVEAASDWTLAEATATDNIDGDLTANIIYSVENVSTSTTLGTGLTHAQAAALLDTTQVGNYLIGMQVSDAAGIYGLNNSNNVDTATKAVLIQDTLPPVIQLTGTAELDAEAGFPYSDPGATASDSLDGNLTSSIVVSGDFVDTNTLGTYILAYGVQDAAGNVAQGVARTVTVQDTLAPVITLSGDAAPYIEAGTAYTDPGVSATDAFDGDLSSSVVVSGDTVDTSTIGTYTIVYGVSDSTGNAAQTVSRTVTVTPQNTPPVVNDQSFSVAENSAEGTSVGIILASDSEGHPLSYSIATNTDPNANGIDAFRLEGNELIVADPSDLDHETAAALAVTVAVTDIELTTTAVMTVNVTNVNEDPSLDTIGNFTIAEDSGMYVVNLTGIAAGPGESGDIRVTAQSDNAALISDPQVIYTSPDVMGTLEITPEADQHGTATIVVSVEDGGTDDDLDTAADNLIVTRSFVVTVTPVNDAPVISDQSFTVPENSTAGTVIGTLTATDVDGGITHAFIADNSDAGFGGFGGAEGTSNTAYGGSYVWRAPSHWYYQDYEHVFGNLPVANYEILATWQSGSSEIPYYPRDPAASYQFYDDTTLAGTTTVNQQQWPVADQVDQGVNFQIVNQSFYVESGTLRVGIGDSSDLLTSYNLNTDAILISSNSIVEYTIAQNLDIDGDGNDAFRIEGDQLIVNDPDDFDFEGTNPIVVSVSASDGADSSSADVTVNLTDVADTPGSISGTFWHDLDEDGAQNGSEPALAGWTAYIDANLNGALDAGEVTTTSDTNGDYSFAGLDAGTYVIGQVLQSNWTQMYPAGVAPQNTTLATAAIETSVQDVAIVSYEADIDDLQKDTESEIISCYWPPSDDFSTNNITENLQPASYPLNETFLLHSNPGASKVIYLDFDGHVTTGIPLNDDYGATLTTPAYSFEGDSSFSNTELQRIQNIWERVAEDFVPFNVNVTTEDPGVEALRDTGAGDIEWGIRVAIGGSSADWYGSAYGVARLESFTDSVDTPCFVFAEDFSNTELMVTVVASHEVGHTLGLRHDGLSDVTAYYEGHGTGPTSWGPIMGKGGQYRSLAHWSKGEYSGADNAQDDLAIITGNNGFGYRVDDHGNALNDATSLASSGNTLVVTSGIIEQNTDQDFFVFATAAGEVNIQIDPFYSSPNLDILATLYDASGTVVATSNPIGQIDAAFNETLTAGFYSISIEGTGEGDVLGEGYSDYGSLGYYEISGTIINPAISGSHTVTLDWAEDVTDIDFGNRVGDSITLDDQSVTVAENTVEQTVVAILNATVASFALTIDNSDSGFTNTSEFVYLNNPNKTAEAYNGDNHFAQIETTGQATWTFNSLPSGEYRVASTWSHQYNNNYNAIDAPFTILDGATPVGSATINQRITPDDFTAEGYGWETLDEVVVTSGSLVVNLGVGSANPNNSTVADAIRIERIGPAAALTYSVLTGVDPDGDGSDAFRIEDDQIVVNDSGDLDYEASSQLIFTVQVSDGTLTDSAQITVDLTDVNERPIIAAPNDQSHTEGDVVSLALMASDPENDPLTWTATDLPPGLLIDDSTGAITGTLTGDSSGSYATEISVTDGSLTDTVLFSWSVVEGDDPPVITLIGASQLTVEASSTGSYSDPGATASDEEDGDLSGSILVSGQLVNLAVIGTYVLNYDVQDSAGNDAETVTRTVVVQDTLAPVITLSGSDTTLIEAGFPYTDAGATASDSLDGDVSGSVVVSGAVDPATPGNYTVLYNVQDAAGNSADPVTRTVTVQDTLRPVISITYSGEVLQVSDHADTGLGGEANAPAGLPSETALNAVGSAGRLQTPIIRSTDFTQPDGSPVQSRQEWTAIEPAGSVSEIPVAAAWDHGDSSIVPSSTIVIIDRDGTPLDETVGAVDFDTRSTYLFEYDAVDDSGNYAEQVVFALILDDQAAPTITVVGGTQEMVEAASGWTLSEATATDNIDGSLTASILYSVENVSTSTTLGTDLTYAEAAALFNTTQVGNYLITIQVSDAAGIYGLNNSNNLATATKAVAIQDTLKPVITLTGDSMINLPQTIGGTYSDPGATAVDSLDGDLSGSVVVGGDVVDLEQDGAYVITYNVQDNAGNVAEQVTRTVNVIPIVVEDVVILDDGEAGFAESGFTQQSNAQVAAAYDSDVHHMQGGSGEASWTFTGLPADRYQVAATWAYKYNNNYNATDAPFTLSDGAGGVFSTQIVNQKLTPGEFEDAGVMWDTLDTVEVSGGTLVVTLGAGSASNKYVVADAIRVSVAATLTLSINDASVAESAGTAATTATVTRNGPTDYPVDVDLLVSDATEISVPTSVTIPAGQASVAFSIDAVDDVFFDGTQSVNVLATAIGYSDGSDSLEILDDETAHTALIDDGEAGFTQSGFTYQSNAQVAAAYNGDNYNLRNGDDADQASWTFTGLDDGAYHVMATWAHKYNNNYNATDAPFAIQDIGGNVLSSVAINQKNAPSQHDVGGTFWDTLDTVYVAGGELTVTVGATAQANKFVVADAVRIEQLVQPSSTLVVQLGEEIVDEDAGTVSGIVSRGAETVGDLVVTLNSDDAAVGTVPATVTIPDGAGAVPFTLTVVDDAVVDGDQNVLITASAAGYTGGSDSLLVEDDEFPPVQIIDNGDAGFTETGGFKERTWAEAYEGDNHYMRGSDGEARWQFTDLIDGEYTVSVTWDHISDNRYNATDAPFTIRNAADEQLLAAAVDQTLSPADFSDGVTDWHTLGTVYVIDGELTVSLTEALVNKYVVADAVRIEIDTNPTSKLLVILDESSVSEAGTLNGKVIRTGDTAGSLTVNLASDNAAAATVPATITLGEGARYGTFAITPTDDSAPDGTQVANIAASAAGFTAGTAALDVTDDDATILFVDNGEDGFVADAGFKRRNVAGAYQNDNHSMRGGTGEASWTFTGLEEGQYFVSATWNHIYENRYNTEKAPFSITNGSGNLLSTLTVDQTQTPADFTDGGYGWEALAPVYINDGTLIVTLGASPTNHHAVADAIRIELNESLAPSLFVLVDTLSESAGASTGTVVRTGDVSSEATVGLTSSNPDAATVEASITFAIGESTKSFVITPTDDSSPDGIQQSTIEATAASYAAGTAVLNVQDDDALEVAIMDNTDNGYTSNGFRYNANKQVSDAYGGNNESLKGGEPGEAASWTFTGLADGVYHVSATWNHQYNNNYNAHDAQYSITNAGDEALATTTINQSNAPSEFLDNGIAWGTLETVTVTGGELIVTVSGGSNPNRHTVADAVRIARVAELGGSSMQSAEAEPFYDPLEDALDDLAGEWGETSADEESLLWGE